MTTPKTSAPEWAASQASPYATVNEAIRRAEAGGGLFRVEDNDATSPPGSCADGAQYIVAATATGAWAGHETHIAIAAGTNASNGWYFITPEEGVRAYIKDENLEQRFDGAAWATIGTGGDMLAANNLSDVANAGTARGNLGLGTAATLASDTDGTLAANSDANLATQKAVKTYVDNLINGRSWKSPVRAATTAAGTLASSFENGDTVDGVTLATGDRILIKDQATASENGIYVVAASGAPARAADADSAAEMLNATVVVEEGTANADKLFTCSTNAPITLGSTSLTFTQIGTVGGGLLASNNLSDVANAATSRTNLGLGSIATFPETTAAQYQANTSGKALSTDKVWSAADYVSLTDASTVAVDMSAFISATVTLGGNRTLGNPSNTKNGQTGVIKIVQDGTGSRTLAYSSNWKFAGGTAPTLTTTASATDLLFYQVISSTFIYATLVKDVK